jgi:hypothetical protein
MWRLLPLALLGALIASCVESATTQCSSGIVCPPGEQCSSTGNACGKPADVAACEGLPDDSYCGDGDAGMTHYCRAGVCSEIACGNGIVDKNEVCDPGADPSCRLDCKGEIGCGNGLVDPSKGEQCDCGDDPANLPVGCSAINSDDLPDAVCNSTCQLRCGDGKIEAGEECDGSGVSCQEKGYYDPGTAACSFCRYDYSTCTGRCGDGIVNKGSPEVCDGSPPPGACVDYGYDFGALDCLAALCTPDLSACRYVGWRDDPGLVGDFTDVYGVFAITYDGLIYQWDKTNRSWSQTDSPIAGLSSVWQSGSVAYAVGYAGLAQWDGSTWTQSTYAPSFTAYLVRGSGPSDVWIAGDAGMVAHFDGTSWTEIDTGTGLPFYSVWSNGPDDVFAAGDGGIAHWDGTGWTATVTSGTISALWGDGKTDVFAAGEFGRIMRWDGASWSDMDSPTLVATFDGLGGTGPDDVYAVAGEPVGNAAIYHWDGFRWQATVEVPEAHLWSVYADPDGTVVAVGSKIWRYQGSHWQLLDDPDVKLDAIDLVGGQPGMAVGDNGVALRYDGVTWRSTETGTHETLTSIWGDAPDDQFAVGGTAILHWDGAAWTASEVSTGPSFVSVWGLGPTDVYASTASELWHYDGSSWTSIYQVGNAGTVWASADDDIYLTQGQDLLHYDALGWSVVASQPGAELLGISGTSRSDVVVVGTAGTIMRWDGFSWSVSSVSADSFERVRDVAPGDFYVGGSNGIVHWVGGGATRIDATPVFDLAIDQSGGTLWAVGDHASVWRSDNSLALQPVVAPLPSNGVTFATITGTSPTDVWVMPSADLPINYPIFHYDDSFWSIVDLPLRGKRPVAVFGAGRDLFLATDADDLWHWDGSAWTHQTITDTIYAMGGSGPTDVYAVGTAVWHLDASGTWTRLSLGVSFDELYGVWAGAPDDVYLAGGSGGTPVVAHWDGSTWSDAAIGLVMLPSQVWGAAANDVFVSDAFGAVEHFDGKVWTLSTLSSDVYAFGGQSGDVIGAGDTSIFHWDARGRWSTVNDPPGQDSFATSSMVTIGDSIWFAGATPSGGAVARLVRPLGWK